MIVPDVNLVVYAYNEDAPFHAAAKSWWQRCLSGNEPVGVAMREQRARRVRR